MSGDDIKRASIEGVGRLLAEIRAELGLTTRAAAERSGISRPTLFNLELHPEHSWKNTTLVQLLRGYGYRAEIVLKKSGE